MFCVKTMIRMEGVGLAKKETGKARRKRKCRRNDIKETEKGKEK